MAVSDPQQINLSPFYSNIIQAIQARAEAESRRPPRTSSLIGQALGQGISAGISKGIESSIETKQESNLLKLKADLEIDSKKRLLAFEEQLKKDIPKDQLEAINKIKENIGKPGYPTEPQYYVGLAAGPEGWKQMAQFVFPDQKATQKPIAVPDKRSSSGYFWGIPDGQGNINITATEAPPPSTPLGGKPHIRAQSLRKEFDQKAKIIGFPSKSDALAEAVKSIENVSISNDKALIFAVAKARDPGGRLSTDDIKQAAEAGSLAEDLQSAYNKIVGGKLLVDNVRKDLFASVAQSYSQSIARFESLEEEQQKIAESEGLDPGEYPVMTDYRPKGIKSFASIDEAEKADLKKGQVFFINGKLAINE